MIRRLGHPLAFLALFAVAGGHWAVLQTVAWAGMVADHARSGPLSTAVAETFDGAHPCPLCLQVEAGKKHEEKLPALVKADKKAEAFLPAAIPIPIPLRVAASWPRPVSLSASPRGDAPPVPPPRRLLPA